ncbi:hypothetical protein B0H17DRAFT_1138258 [Mycena rosella]|uniref:Uncharacterized protein n=1 Tax=Mycena rosella TaxID=1033263 RepID=A0AAD7D859_MYCRO|nr:hypothetical protein B0H17DRAFT_1138258 [Mycena rosella]
MYRLLSRVLPSALLLLLVTGQTLAAPQGASGTSPAAQNLARGVVFLAHCPATACSTTADCPAAGCTVCSGADLRRQGFCGPGGGAVLRGKAGLGFKADWY